MIIYDTEYPELVSPAMLDDYLARGWYRIGQVMMTTDVSFTETSSFIVFWLRFDINKYRPGKAAKKIALMNTGFQVENKPFAITEEIEGLFEEYKTSIDFEMTKTVSEYLLGTSAVNIYSTRLLEIRDGNRLISAGYFDEGVEANAGILNFYHPDYRKYSPGKQLMLEKIKVCQNSGKRYFYPGYISNEFPKFNYKLFTGKEAAEIYVRPQKQWLPLALVNMEELAKTGW